MARPWMSGWCRETACVEFERARGLSRFKHTEAAVGPAVRFIADKRRRQSVVPVTDASSAGRITRTASTRPTSITAPRKVRATTTNAKAVP